MILDDLTNELNIGAPSHGEKIIQSSWYLHDLFVRSYSRKFEVFTQYAEKNVTFHSHIIARDVERK